MPQGLTNYMEQKILDTMFGNATWASVPTVWVGIHVGTALSATDLEAATNITEPVAMGYLRVAVTNNATNWPTATQNGANEGTKSNGAIIPFPTATGNWGTAQNWFVSDSATVGGGNYWAIGALTTPKAINTNDTASFAVGTITITLD